MNVPVSEIVELVEGKLLAGDPAARVAGFSSLEDALPGDLCFFHDARYRDRLKSTRATALLLPVDWGEFPAGVACIGVADPSKAFEKTVERFGVQPVPFAAGTHPSAVVADSAKLDRSKVALGANAVIDEGAELADGVEIGAGCYIGRDVRIGREAKLFANVTVHLGCTLGERVILHSGVVIGADGFGYEFHQGRHRKIRQSGVVQIDSDVEIGANSTVDRARFGRTWIGEGTKIDNQVQVGHNVVIGRHCIVVACSAIAGSAVIGDYVVMAAQCGVGNHIKVGSQSTLGGRSGVTKDVPPGQTYMGFPAVPAGVEKRRIASVNRIPKLVARIKELEDRIKG